MDNPNSVRLDRAIADWNRGDLERYLTLYDEGIRLHGYAPEPMDKESVRGFYEQHFAAFPGGQIELLHTFADGDDVVTRFVMRGRHEAEFLGVPATGRDIELNGITILRFRDGLVVERWSQADMLGLLVQFGAVPAPA
ncbi:MAG TPA: ester cyclase [Thermoleophilaceae bacterium]|nr:ester cyclase [Thermoleophilaceae bacterium]